MEDFYATYGRSLNLQKYVRLAARVCNRPYALLHLFEQDKQHLLAEHGTLSEIGFCMKKEDSICDYTAKLETGALLSIPDTFIDSRVMHLPAVAGPPHYRWYLGTPLRSANGELLGALCVLDQGNDTTEATEEMQAGLVDLAECLTTELALRADCNVALRAKKDFLTSVSHELRDPMHGISMGIELLSSIPIHYAEEKLALDTVRTCSNSLEGLVDKILKLNNKEAGITSTVEMEVVNIAELVEQVLDSTWNTSMEHSPSISPSAVVPLIKTTSDMLDREHLSDRRSLASIVHQLFDNAKKFTKAGFISSTLR